MMADGSGVNWQQGCDVEAVALDEAIAMLKRGADITELSVDLGDGAIARMTESGGPKGLLQRLRGHKLLMALADSDSPAEVFGDDTPDVDDDARALLDAVKQTG